MKKAKNVCQESCIDVIKTDVEWIKKEVDDIKGNHLKHIYDSLEEIKEDIATRPTWLITGIMSLLVGLIAFLLTK